MAVIAAIGLIIATGASPKGLGDNSKQTKTQQEIASTLQRIAVGIEDGNKPKRKTRDCPKGTEDRQSDLCAQWKAADAAQQAADAADRTVIVGWVGIVLSTLTFGAAFAAAYFARRAAIATENTVEETRRIGEAQTRAYLGFDVVSGDVAPGKPIKFQVRITNHGQSPANDAAFASNVVIRGPNWDRGELTEPQDAARPAVTIHPRGFFDTFAEMEPPVVMTDEIIAFLRNGKSCVFCTVTVFFRDEFEEQWVTQLAIEFSGEECFKSGKPRMSAKGNYNKRLHNVAPK